MVRFIVRDVMRQDAPDTSVRCVLYDESNVIWVRDSDSVRDRVKVTVTSVVLVTGRVMFRDVNRHRRTSRTKPDPYPSGADTLIQTISRQITQIIQPGKT